MPSSKQKEALAGCSKKEGYIGRATPSRTTRAPERTLSIQLKYSPERRGHLRHPPGVQARPAGVQQVHRGPPCPRWPRRRWSVDSQGLMTDREARKRRVGGEVLCYVW
jgi:small subunit ribosomal protein S8